VALPAQAEERPSCHVQALEAIPRSLAYAPVFHRSLLPQAQVYLDVGHSVGQIATY